MRGPRDALAAGRRYAIQVHYTVERRSTAPTSVLNAAAITLYLTAGDNSSLLFSSWLVFFFFIFYFLTFPENEVFKSAYDEKKKKKKNDGTKRKRGSKS